MLSKKHVPDQLPSEEVVMHLRRHWLIFAGPVMLILLLALAPIFLYFFLSAVWPNFMADKSGWAVFETLGLAYYLVLLVFLFTFWTDIYLDVWTLTTYRVVNREQNGLFNRVVSELTLTQVQDVTAEQKGFLATIFQYGNVYIQTAGERERFVFEQVPEPYRVAKIIQKLAESAQKNAHSTL